MSHLEQMHLISPIVHVYALWVIYYRTSGIATSVIDYILCPIVMVIVSLARICLIFTRSVYRCALFDAYIGKIRFFGCADRCQDQQQDPDYSNCPFHCYFIPFITTFPLCLIIPDMRRLYKLSDLLWIAQFLRNALCLLICPELSTTR